MKRDNWISSTNDPDGITDNEAGFLEQHTELEPEVSRGFHNDTTPRYDTTSAKLA